MPENGAELLVDFIISLDGYASAEGWPGWWGLEGPEYLQWLEESPEADYTILMGATTYRLMSGFLAPPGEPGSLEMSDQEQASVEGLAGMPKLVFSSTLQPPYAWPNTEVVSRDAVDEVAERKRAGTSMRTIGSLSLCRSLLEAGLVDRFRVVVFPVITGKTGRERIYDGYPDVALELIDSRLFDGRTQLLEYRPTLLTGPPNTGSER
jgi:dihydrofolate reductase